jgi:hypothetical protein
MLLSYTKGDDEMKNGGKRALWGVQTILGMILVLAACGNGNTAHTHDFDTAWKSDETQHWHVTNATTFFTFEISMLSYVIYIKLFVILLLTIYYNNNIIIN